MANAVSHLLLLLFYACTLTFVLSNALYVPFDNSIVSDEPTQENLKHLLEELVQSELAAKQANAPSVEFQQLQVHEIPDWPNGSNSSALRQLKQTASVAFSNDGRLFVFHRADRVWNESTKIESLRSAIASDTVLIVNASNGDVLGSWGANQFFMPHGISLDREGNVWLTDVASHQVFRFQKDSYDAPDLVLGEQFVSGSDEQHFCMPTDVQVASNGFVYIADGYCNSRILIVAPDGTSLGQIAYKDDILVPHSLTLLEHEDLICVADRERQRILCYSAGLTDSQAGELRFQLQHPSLHRVFGISHVDDLLIAVNGPSLDNQNKDDPVGLVLDLATERVLTSFYPKKAFKAPHDVDYDPITKSLIVVDLQSPDRQLIKFQIDLAYN